MHQPKQETAAEPTTSACDVSRRDFTSKGGARFRLPRFGWPDDRATAIRYASGAERLRMLMERSQ